jgi:hypothetical protein
LFQVLSSTLSKVERIAAPTVVNIVLWMLMASASTLFAQTLPARVEVHFGALDTISYPSRLHPTEWKQELVAELYDSSGHVLPPSSEYLYTWGVDFCKGYGLVFGWASGYGLSVLSPDGNKIKVEEGCCHECPHQAYKVSVKVTIGELVVQSKHQMIPNIALPSTAGISANYPNPFSTQTFIRFQLNEYSYVTLHVYDILGQSLGELLNQYLPPGFHSMVWHPSNAPAGVYFYRLTINPPAGSPVTRIEKMILQK